MLAYKGMAISGCIHVWQIWWMLYRFLDCLRGFKVGDMVKWLRTCSIADEILAQTVHYHNIQILLAVFLEALGVDPS